MTRHFIIIATIMSISLFSCNQAEQKQTTEENDFQFLTEQFADLRIMRYQIPGFEDLSLKQKEMIYYLGEAALAGRAGGVLRAVSAEDGASLGECKLEAPPVFDGMAAANGCLFVSTMSGKVLCFK